MIYMINTDDLNVSLVINYNTILKTAGIEYKSILDEFIVSHSTKDELGYNVVNFMYINDFRRIFPDLFKIIMNICKVKTI